MSRRVATWVTLPLALALVAGCGGKDRGEGRFGGPGLPDDSEIPDLSEFELSELPTEEGEPSGDEGSGSVADATAGGVWDDEFGGYRYDLALGDTYVAADGVRLTVPSAETYTGPGWERYVSGDETVFAAEIAIENGSSAPLDLAGMWAYAEPPSGEGAAHPAEIPGAAEDFEGVVNPGTSVTRTQLWAWDTGRGGAEMTVTVVRYGAYGTAVEDDTLINWTGTIG